MAQPDLPPLGNPPADLLDRDLVVAAWTSPLYRIHQRDPDPLFFGKTRLHRFDDPDQEYGVRYASTDLEGAFSETLGGASFCVGELSDRSWMVGAPTNTGVEALRHPRAWPRSDWSRWATLHG